MKTARRSPIYQDPLTGFHVISRHIAYIVKHPEVFSNTTTVTFGGGEDTPGYKEVQALYDEHGWSRMHTLVTADPPVHTRYRSLVDKVFAPIFHIHQIDSLPIALAPRTAELGIKCGASAAAASLGPMQDYRRGAQCDQNQAWAGPCNSHDEPHMSQTQQEVNWPVVASTQRTELSLEDRPSRNAVFLRGPILEVRAKREAIVGRSLPGSALPLICKTEHGYV